MVGGVSVTGPTNYISSKHRPDPVARRRKSHFRGRQSQGGLASHLRDSVQLAGLWAAFAVIPLTLGFIFGWEVQARSATWHLGWFAATYLPGVTFFFLLLGLGSRRIASRILGAAWGVVAALPLCLGLAFSMNRGYEDWTDLHTFLLVISALGFGSVLGAYAVALEDRHGARKPR
jgi:hypothetical protein